MDLRLFRIRAFMAGATANLLTSISRSSLSLILVFYLQGVLLYSAYDAGILLLPFSVAFVLVGPLSGALSDRFGPRYFAPTGLVLSSLALFWFATIPYDVSYLDLAIPMLLAGAGGGMFFAPNVAAIMNSVPPARRGVASGMSSTLFNVGALISLGAVFAIFSASVPLTALQAIVAGLTPPAGSLNIQQFIGAMHLAFLIMGVISLAAALPASQTGSRRKETIMYPDTDSD
jgi:MFS family permease